jgi:23S rRNA pseudouridine1911/1915/1917 synthase
MAIEEPEQEQVDVEVPPLLGGVRLDRALSMLTGISRNEAAGLIKQGVVSVNGRTDRLRSFVLSEGDRIEAVVTTSVPLGVEAEPEVEVDVIFEDPNFLVVNKAAHLIVHPGAGHREGTMVAGLLAKYPDIAEVGFLSGGHPDRPGIVHRLDRGTSGLLVVARNEAAYQSLVGQLSARDVDRWYLALVRGLVEDERGVVDAPIGRSLRSPTMMAVSRDGRPARTAYEVVERYEGSAPRTLVRCKLETGRTHQIRVHLAAIGHPVVGDARYGRLIDPELGRDRFFLHAYRLGFEHPVSGEYVSFTAELPEDLSRLVGTGIDLDV